MSRGVDPKLPDPGDETWMAEWEEELLEAQKWVPQEAVDPNWRLRFGDPTTEVGNLALYSYVHIAMPRKRVRQISGLAHQMGMSRDSLFRLLIAEFIVQRTGEDRTAVFADFPLGPPGRSVEAGLRGRHHG